MGLTAKIADSRRRKLTEFLNDGHLEDGESVEASLPMLQTHVGRFAGYYGVAVTPQRVLVVEWGRKVPEQPKGLVDAASRQDVSLEEHTTSMLMGKLVLSRDGERWIGLKVPRIHRDDAQDVARALSR